MTLDLLLVEEFPSSNKTKKLIVGELEQTGLSGYWTVSLHTESKPFGYKTTAGDITENRERILAEINKRKKIIIFFSKKLMTYVQILYMGLKLLITKY